MNFGKVIGVLVSTKKVKSLDASRLYVLEPQNENHQKVGGVIIAADTVGAREGDQVIWVSSREAALAMDDTFTPVDAAIVGIVDSYHVEERE